jgi:hypothetical protein
MYKGQYNKFVVISISIILMATVSIALLPCKISASGCPQEAYPSNAEDMPVTNIAFNWTPHIGIVGYTFELARDTTCSDLVKSVNLSKPAYLYTGRLDYSTNYFWRVRGSEPMPTGWSASFYFQTVARPSEYKEVITSTPDSRIWIIFGAVGLLIILITALVFKTR